MRAWSITRTIRPESAVPDRDDHHRRVVPLGGELALDIGAHRADVHGPAADIEHARGLDPDGDDFARFSSPPAARWTGRFSSSAISLTKEVVTMKKISMMKTMSSIGVMLISASSSPLAILRFSCGLNPR
jgi:hypothetical protein